MITFERFYQQIAVSPLSHWLETLPAQIAAGNVTSFMVSSNSGPMR